MGVSKTDFMRGMQCPKMLWLDKHRPEEKVIPPEIREKLDAGNEFGDRAMSLFGEYVEVTTFKENGFLDYKAMIEKTKDCLENGTRVICEGSFTYYNNFCSVDILRKTEKGYELYEVKNSPEVKEQFVQDLAFQRYIVTRCGVKITKCFVVYHGEDEQNPFQIEEVTDRVRAYYQWIDENIWRMGKVKLQKEEVKMPMGEQCTSPYACWYIGYCSKNKDGE